MAHFGAVSSNMYLWVNGKYVGYSEDSIRGNENVKKIIKYFVDNNLTIGAICHGQQTLISAKVLEGKDATCYIGIKDDLMNAKANYKDERVVVCGNIITSRCPDDLPYFTMPREGLQP